MRTSMYCKVILKFVAFRGNHGIAVCKQRRRIYTEETAKVIAAVWGIELIQLLATLSVLHQDDMKKRMNCTRMILFFKSSW